VIKGELTRATLSVLFIGALLVGSLWILRPFLGAAIWAAMVVVATWPVLLRLQARLGGHRWPAATVMTLLLLLLFAVPLVLALLTIVENADELVAAAKALTSLELPAAPPDWLVAVPLVGEKVAEFWQRTVAAGIAGLLGHLQPYAGNLTKWIVGEIGSIGFVVLQFVLIVVFAGVMYTGGDHAALVVRRFARRLGGDNGEAAVRLAAGAIRGVALGVGITALVQAVLGGVGLAIAGVPFAGVLTALMFMLCIAQVGALPVLVPATIWVFWKGETGWGIFLLVWSLIVGTMDNFLRPVLIRMGADLPLLLIFSGVIGGLLAFGLVGIFVGPVVLAVTYTLLANWIEDGGPPVD
jgi:predicted PurR-regulated permease PerM